MQIKLICILCDTGGKVSYTFPPCVHADFSASDANPVHFPLAKYCVPCVPSGTGGTLLSQPSHKTTQAPCSPPGGPFWPSFTPGGETTRPARTEAGLGPTGASLAERKENSPTRKTTASVTGEYASFRLPTRRMVSQKPEVVKGVKKEQVKGPGSPTGVPCRVTSPGRAERSGIFPRR